MQQCQQRSLLPAAETNGLAVAQDFERTQHAEPQHPNLGPHHERLSATDVSQLSPAGKPPPSSSQRDQRRAIHR